MSVLPRDKRSVSTEFLSGGHAHAITDSAAIACVNAFYFPPAVFPRWGELMGNDPEKAAEACRPQLTLGRPRQPCGDACCWP